MEVNKLKAKRKKRRHLRIRKKVIGTSEQPRLSVFRSIHHMYGQIIDDEVGQTLVACSTQDPTVRSGLANSGNRDAAAAVGRKLATKAMAAGISKVTFDRAGYRYHGRVKSLAEAARKEGLKF
jgi:large subunit ribosomal protein L18